MAAITQTKHHEEEYAPQEYPSEAMQASALQNDSTLRKPEQPPVSKKHDEHAFEKKPARALHTHELSSEAQAPESSPGTSDTFHMSVNYLKNKTREGALYYHHDKAFFKKFFKSSHKKKS
jgi:hypothetical protein